MPKRSMLFNVRDKLVKARISETLQQDMENILKNQAWVVRGVKEIHIEVSPISFYED